MSPLRIGGAVLLCASFLYAEDFTLKFFDDGPIALHTVLTNEGNGERLVATAKNESGSPIQRAKICISSASVKRGCLFEVWNTAVWAPGAELSWNVTTALRVADLSHDAMIEEYETVKPTDTTSRQPVLQPSPSEAPKIATPSPAPEALTNETLIRLTKARLGDDVIVGMVKSQPGHFVVSPDGVIALKEAGVSDQVIAAVVSKRTDSEPIPSVPEVGIYYSKGGAWVDLKPEIVDLKAGGVVKSVASLGIVKHDINGLVNGPTSPNSLTNPVEILLYSVEGVAATEYQFVRLHEHEKNREFRTITGGVFHESEGTTRDLVEFVSTKIAARLYRITFNGLAPGEYGFLPPNAELPNRASASVGKIFTFHVSE
jgi:hypothetical protein